jgi:trimeric autotransporter adhesin
MTDHVWEGGAPEDAQVDTFTIPSDVEGGQVFTATIGNKALTYTFLAGATQASVRTAIIALWNASIVPEFAEITASAGTNAGAILLTSDEDGKPFIVSTKIGSGTNEIQVITLGGSPTGGTFTLTYSGQTTGNIAYNADAATVDAALEALSNIGAGDVGVTGSAGGPWTVEFTGALAATDVALLTASSANLVGTSEQQVISLGTASGGTFTLTYSGQTTGNIAYNADAATVEAALEGLSNIGAGEATTTGSAGGPWTVAFSGALAGTDLPEITVDGTNLTGKLAVGVTETVDGVAGGENEVHLFHAVGSSGVDGAFTITGDVSVSSGTFTLGITVGGTAIFTTDAIAYNATLTAIQAAIDAKAASSLYFNAGEIHITGEVAGATLVDGATLSVRVSCAVGASGVIVPTITNSLTGGTYSAAAVTSVTNSSTSTQTGSFYITYGSYTTDDIDINASAAQVEAALEALSNIGSGNASVSQTFGTGLADSGTFIVEFTGTLSNQNVGLTPVIGTNSGTDYTLSAAKAWTGLAGTNEVQQITITGSPGSGTFALEYGGVQTALLSYDSTAAEVEAALEALSTIGTGNVSCTGGDLPGTAVDVEFIADLSSTSLALIVAPGGSVAESVAAGSLPTVSFTTSQTPIIVTNVTPNSGPSCWDVAANWSTGTVPVSSDNVFIVDGDNILYGLDQSAVTLGRLEIGNKEVEIGLPRRNTDYIEYRDIALKIGAATIVTGLGAGNSSDRIQIDFGATSPAITVHASGRGTDEPAVQFTCTNATNTASLEILGGEVGVAVYPNQEAHFASIIQRSGDLTIGSDVTLLGLNRTGGSISIDEATIDGTISL